MRPTRLIWLIGVPFILFSPMCFPSTLVGNYHIYENRKAKEQVFLIKIDAKRRTRHERRLQDHYIHYPSTSIVFNCLLILIADSYCIYSFQSFQSQLRKELGNLLLYLVLFTSILIYKTCSLAFLFSNSEEFMHSYMIVPNKCRGKHIGENKMLETLYKSKYT